MVEDASGDDVRHGTTVEVTDLGKGGTQTFKIVSPNEANPKEGLISSTSPVAQALIGSRRRRRGRDRDPGGRPPDSGSIPSPELRLPWSDRVDSIS